MWIFLWSFRHAKIWVGMQEHTESTHEEEEILTQKERTLVSLRQDRTIVSRLPIVLCSVHAKLASNALDAI